MKRTVLFLIMISLAAFGTYANGTAETTEKVNFSQEELAYEPVREITVEPTGEILSAFESLGIASDYLVEGSYTDDQDNTFRTPAPVTMEVRSELEDIIAENRGNVVDLINAELQSKLHRGGAELAHMTIGSYSFTASLDYPEA